LSPRKSVVPHDAHAVDVSEICFKLAQPISCLFGMFALRDIDHGADYLNKLSVGTHYGMGQAKNVFERSIR
jgi:hypothetical protein